MTVTRKQFVEIFESSKNLEEAASRMGTDKRSVSLAAYALRQQGVKLKVFQHHAGTVRRPPLLERTRARVVKPVIESYLPNEEFIRIWETSSSATEAARRAGMPRETASSRALLLR